MEKDNEFKVIELSNCEKMILGCVYEYHNEHEEAPNLRDIMGMLSVKYAVEWKLQTVCTFFSRIEKKGLLTIAKEGRYSYYYPVVPYDVYVNYELMVLCKMFFGEKVKLLKKFVRKL